MTVLEVVKTYHIEDFEKDYKNVYGNCINTKYPLDKLAKMDVKDVYINLMIKTATITVLPMEED